MTKDGKLFQKDLERKRACVSKKRLMYPWQPDSYSWRLCSCPFQSLYFFYLPVLFTCPFTHMQKCQQGSSSHILRRSKPFFKCLKNDPFTYRPLDCYVMAVSPAAGWHYNLQVSTCHQNITCVIHSDINILEVHWGVCVHVRMPVSSSFLIAGWTKVGEGAEAHSSDEAKTWRAQDKLCSILVSLFGSESISLLLLIFCKLIVSLVVDILQRTKKIRKQMCLTACVCV